MLCTMYCTMYLYIVLVIGQLLSPGGRSKERPSLPPSPASVGRRPVLGRLAGHSVDYRGFLHRHMETAAPSGNPGPSACAPGQPATPSDRRRLLQLGPSRPW